MDLLHFAQAISSKSLALPCSQCNDQISVKLSEFLIADSDVTVQLPCNACQGQTLLKTFTSTSLPDPSSTYYMNYVRQIRNSSPFSNFPVQYSSNWNRTTETLGTNRSTWYYPDEDEDSDDNEGSEGEDDGQWSTDLNYSSHRPRPPSTVGPYTAPLKNTSSEFSLLLKGMEGGSERRVSRRPSVVLSRISLSTTQSHSGTRKSTDGSSARRGIPETSRGKRMVVYRAGDEAERRLTGIESSETISSMPPTGPACDFFGDSEASSSSSVKPSEKQRGKSPVVVSSKRRGRNMHRVAVSRQHSLRQVRDGNTPAVTRSNSLTNTSTKYFIPGGNSVSSTIQFKPSVEIFEPDSVVATQPLGLSSEDWRRIQPPEAVAQGPAISNFSRPLINSALEGSDMHITSYDDGDGGSLQGQSREAGTDNVTASWNFAKKGPETTKPPSTDQHSRFINRLRHFPQRFFHRRRGLFHRPRHNPAVSLNFITSAYLSEPEPTQLLPTSLPAATIADSFVAEDVESSSDTNATDDNPTVPNTEPSPDENAAGEVHPTAISSTGTTRNLNEGEANFTSDGFVDELRELRQDLNAVAHQRLNNGDNPMLFSITLSV